LVRCCIFFVTFYQFDTGGRALAIFVGEEVSVTNAANYWAVDQFLKMQDTVFGRNDFSTFIADSGDEGARPGFEVLHDVFCESILNKCDYSA